MATLTIRNIDDDLKRRLRLAATASGLSMGEHVRTMLRRSVDVVEQQSEVPLGLFMRSLFSEVGGVELELPSRDTPVRWEEFGP